MVASIVVIIKITASSVTDVNVTYQGGDFGTNSGVMVRIELFGVKCNQLLKAVKPFTILGTVVYGYFIRRRFEN